MNSNIIQSRKYIYNSIIPRLGGNPNNINLLTAQDFRELFRLYDELFFESKLKTYLNEQNIIFIKFSDKMTSAAGSCQRKNSKDPRCRQNNINIYTIKLSRPLLNSVFSSPNQIETNAGLQCYNRLECLQLTFEHELIHLYLRLQDLEDIRSHGKEFQQLATSLFGHTDFRHTIGRGLEEDPKVYIEKVLKYLRPGMYVDVYDPKTKNIEKYEVIEINKKSNTKRFVGQKNIGKTFRIPLVHVILPK